MKMNVAVIPGDYIGPEVVAETIKVLEKVASKFGHSFTFKETCMGGASIDKFGIPLTEECLAVCKSSDSVLLGAVGGPQWDEQPADKRPEKGLLMLRNGLNLFANLRPAMLYKPLAGACPLKEDIIKRGIDIVVVRELTGGIYFGERGKRQGKYGNEAYDVEAYSEFEVTRIAKVAFELAMIRNKNLTSIDKANVLESSRLWRRIVTQMQSDYPEVALSHMYVDNAAMQLVRDPSQFDVIVTSNLFGDILSDEASMITGSIGMLPSASLGDGSLGLYEPIHGSAPDIAGQDMANPIATILSAALMLKYSFKLHDEAAAMEKAVETVLEQGVRTADIYSAGMKKVGTVEMGRLIAEHI